MGFSGDDRPNRPPRSNPAANQRKRNFYKRRHEIRHRGLTIKIALDPLPFNPALHRRDYDEQKEVVGVKRHYHGCQLNAKRAGASTRKYLRRLGNLWSCAVYNQDGLH